MQFECQLKNSNISMHRSPEFLESTNVMAKRKAICLIFDLSGIAAKVQGSMRIDQQGGTN
jgi:hypothetical protein